MKVLLLDPFTLIIQLGLVGITGGTPVPWNREVLLWN
jgi:hypothetical protein